MVWIDPVPEPASGVKLEVALTAAFVALVAVFGMPVAAAVINR